MNTTLATKLPLPVSPPGSYDSPHSKAHLLLQAHFSRTALPIADYQTDTKSVLDQALRILQVRPMASYSVSNQNFHLNSHTRVSLMGLGAFAAPP